MSWPSFQRRKWRKSRIGFSVPVVLLVAAIVVFVSWAFVAIDPFQPANPFLREVTIGQDIMGDWRYAGVDASGQLRFYDAYQSVLLPADSPTFAADGQFITIDAHTPTTLTFEPSYESETIGPVAFLWIGLLIAAVVTALRHRSKRLPPRFRGRPPVRK